MLSMSYRLTIGVLSFLVQVVNVFRIKAYEDIYSLPWHMFLNKLWNGEIV